MPHYLFKKDGDISWLERVDAGFNPEGKDVETPSQADLPSGDVEATTLFRCDVCDEEGVDSQFRKKMHFARHFNHNHPNFKDTKDSWRDYVSEVRV